MSKYRHALPQLQEELLLTDGGIETTLIFHEGATLPYFASFVLLEDESGTALLRRYFERYAELARAEGLGLVLETPTWRANPDWAAKLGYDAPALAEANRRSVDLLLGIRRSFESGRTRIVISGNLGPRGDGYNPDMRMSAAEAQVYHAPQIEIFAATEADMIAAFTMNYVEEAVGIVRAARAAAMPVAVRRAVRAVLLDIDDTLTSDGRLTSAAYDALERLAAAGLRVVPVTGRPAGWCDMIARFWPVDAVVGEMVGDDRHQRPVGALRAGTGRHDADRASLAKRENTSRPLDSCSTR